MHEPSVRVVPRDQLSENTPQTSGMRRAVAFDSRNRDAKVLSAFLSMVLPGAATGAHHHGDQETIRKYCCVHHDVQAAMYSRRHRIKSGLGIALSCTSDGQKHVRLRTGSRLHTRRIA
jgi:hypothetical protein